MKATCAYRELSMDHPYGILSLLPPMAAIVLAIVTRRAALSLLLGVVIGALLLAGGNPLAAIPRLFETHLWAAATDDGRLRVFAFTLMMGAMVGVISRSGAMRSLVDAVTPLARTRRRGQLVGWLLGMVVFFDDYANTILLGTTLRPLYDKLKISREKLAYVVDSTSAPVAGLALISTWVAVEIENIRLGLADVGDFSAEETTTAAFDLFIYSIPYRFYMLGALVLVPLVALTGRDIGAMRRAESLAFNRDDKRSRDGEPPAASQTNDPQGHWSLAIAPILLCIAVIVTLLWQTGTAALVAKNADLAAAGKPPIELSLQNIFGAADSYIALLWGSAAGLALAMFACRVGKLLDTKQVTEAAMGGAKLMFPALIILWLAASLSGMTQGEVKVVQSTDEAAGVQQQRTFPDHETKLYTGTYLSDQVQRIMGGEATSTRPRMLWLLPTIIFILASIVAFATGTSWGTMGILMPMAVPLAHSLLAAGGADVSLHDPLLLCTVAGVLSGAIFGDHCSPISDTTVLSSQASGCDHVAHVWTQLPYALLVGAIAILLGTLPVGLGISVWLLLPAGLIAIIVALFLLGRKGQPES